MKHDQLIGAALPWIALFVAISLAGAAAYISVIGLTTIFIGAILPVAIMGGLIEASKLVSASWLYRNWSLVARKLKWGLTALVIIAMLVTSLGIFGFLSRAYTEHSADNQGLNLEVVELEQRIEQQQDTRQQAQKTLDQINSSLNTLIEYDKISGEDGYRAVRERNLPTINEMQDVVDRTSQRISELNQQKMELEKTVAVSEAEIGPIRFVAEMIWGEENAKENYDRAVRMLIMLLVFIFDPFAILLLLAANHSLMMRQQQKIDNKPKGEGGEEDDPLPKTPSDGMSDLQPVKPLQDDKEEDSNSSNKSNDDVMQQMKNELQNYVQSMDDEEVIEDDLHTDDDDEFIIEDTVEHNDEESVDIVADPIHIESTGDLEFINGRSRYTYRNKHGFD